MKSDGTSFLNISGELMKKIFFKALVMPIFLFLALGTTYAQKVGFMNSETIRDKFPEAKQAEQRVQSVVEEWKRELAAMQLQIDNLEFEIKKNRLIWTDNERTTKEKEFQNLKFQKEGYAKTKFEPNGEYDLVVKQIMKPIEEKIYAAVQKVATEEGYDIIWDQSTQPLPYLNFKYDITIKILRELGVDVDELQKQLNEKIDKDPRNEKKEPRKTRRKSRTSTDPNAKPEDEKVDETKDKEPNPSAKPEEREIERKEVK